MGNIPEVYRAFVDEVIGNCAEVFSEENVCDSVLVQLKELWLSKLEAVGDEYIDLNCKKRNGSKNKIVRKTTRVLIKKKKEPTQSVNTKPIEIEEIPSTASMPELDEKVEEYNEHLQQILKHRNGIKSNWSLRPRKKLGSKNKIVRKTTRVLIKKKKEPTQSVNTKPIEIEEIPSTASMPELDEKVEESNEHLQQILKRRNAIKSNWSFRPRKKLEKINLPATPKSIRKVIQKRISKRIPRKKMLTEPITNNNSVTNHTFEVTDGTESKLEADKNCEKQNNLVKRKNGQTALNREADEDLATPIAKPCTVQEYNYVYKNKSYACKDELGYTRVKIILPHRTGYSIEQRTCIVTAPCWTLAGTKLPKLVGPLIKKVTNLTITDAALALQEHINTYYEILQVDGSGIKVNVKAQNRKVEIVRNSIKDSSDIDSSDDVTDDEDNATSFESKNHIMCLFSDVKHTRYSWKLKLHRGIMKINNKVFMFQTVSGNVEW